MLFSNYQIISTYPALQAGSLITMDSPSGTASGPDYSLDPSGYVKWPSPSAAPSADWPAGCGTANSLNVMQGVVPDVSTFTTISGAVASLKASLAGTGLSEDTCIVIRDNKVYAESVLIDGIEANDHRLIIMADPAFAGGANPVIEPPALSNSALEIKVASVTLTHIGVIAASSLPYGIVVSSPDVNISGLTIHDVDQNMGFPDLGFIESAGIYFKGAAAHGTVEQTYISAGGYGILDESAGGNNVNNSIVYSLDSDAVSFAGDNNSVTNSTIGSGGPGGGTGRGVYSNGDWNTISGTRVLINSAYGVYFDAGSSNNSVTGCTFDGKDYYTFDGVGLYSNGLNNSVTSDFSNTGRLAIEYGPASSSGTISGCTVNNTSYDGDNKGVEIDGSSVTVRLNNIYSYGTALAVSGIYQLVTDNPQIQSEQDDALVVYSSASLFAGNNITGYSGSGVVFEEGGYNALGPSADNICVVTSYYDAGLSEASPGGNTITQCAINSYYHNGVYFESVSGGGDTITFSTITSAYYRDGLIDEGAGSNKVSQCLVSGGYSGIDLEGSGRDQISLSTISASYWGGNTAGLRVGGEGNNTITDCSITSDYFHGVYLEGQGGNAISGSIVRANYDGYNYYSGSALYDQSNGGNNITQSTFTTKSWNYPALYLGNSAVADDISESTITAPNSYGIQDYSQAGNIISQSYISGGWFGVKLNGRDTDISDSYISADGLGLLYPQNTGWPNYIDVSGKSLYDGRYARGFGVLMDGFAQNCSVSLSTISAAADAVITQDYYGGNIIDESFLYPQNGNGVLYLGSGGNIVSGSTITAVDELFAGVKDTGLNDFIYENYISAASIGIYLSNGSERYSTMIGNTVSAADVGIDDESYGYNSIGWSGITAATAVRMGSHRSSPDLMYWNTISGALVGLDIARNPAVNPDPGVGILGLTFQDPLPANSTAINFEGSEVFVSTFTSVVFNSANTQFNVNAVNLLDGSAVSMVNSVGISSGPAHENDIVLDPEPGYVQWNTVVPPPSSPGCDLLYNVLKDTAAPSPGYYPGIQEALDAFHAAYFGMRPGNVCVIVRDTETYAGASVLGPRSSFYRLTIMADPTFVSSAPVVDPALGGNWTAFDIEAGSVTISHINIIPTAQVDYGIYAGQADSLIVSGVSIRDTGGMFSSYGIYKSDGDLTITGSTVAVGNGDSIWGVRTNDNGTGRLSITDSYIHGSGAVYVYNAEKAAISGSVLVSNSAAGYGFYSYGIPGGFSLVSSTVTGGASGAGVRVDGSAGAVSIADSHIQGGDAVYFSQTANTAISGSVLISKSDTGNGFNAYVSGDFSLVSSTVTGGANGEGVGFYGAEGRDSITDSYIQGANAVSIDYGGKISISTSVLVSNFDAGYGLDAYVSGDFSLVSSTVTGGANGAGVWLYYDNPSAVVLSSVTIAGSMEGLVLQGYSSNPGAFAVSDIVFRDMPAGLMSTAIDFIGYQFIVSTFTGVSFNSPNIDVNVNAYPTLSDGSTIYMVNHSGPKTGPAYAFDLLGQVKWGPETLTPWSGGPIPAGCGDASVNVAQNGASGAFTSIGGAVASLTSLSANTCIVIRDSKVYRESVLIDSVATNGYRLTVMGDPALGPAIPVVSGHYGEEFLSHAREEGYAENLDAVFQITAASVTLNNLAVIPEVETLYGVEISSPDMKLSSVTIRDAYQDIDYAALYLTGEAANTVVEDSQLSLYSDGVYDDSLGGNRVSRSRINSNYGHAVYFTAPGGGETVSQPGPEQAASANNSVIDSTIEAGGYGFYSDGANNNISRSVIIPDGQGSGVYLDYNSSSNSVNSCLIEGIPDSYVQGVYSYGAANSIIGGAISVAGGGAIFEGAGNLVSGASISVWGDSDGVSLYGEGSNIITGSTIATRGWSGIHDASSGSNIITGSIISARDYGVYFEGGNDNANLCAQALAAKNVKGCNYYNYGGNTISGSVISAASGSEGYGVYYYATGGGNSISGSTIAAAGYEEGYGVYYEEDAGQNTISASVISAASGDEYEYGSGIGLHYGYSGGENSISGSTITATGHYEGYGVVSDEDAGQNTISASVISASGMVGFGVLDYSYGGDTISESSITAAGGEYVAFGVYDDGYGENSISGSSITATGGDEGYGIYDESDGGNTISGSTIAATGVYDGYGIYDESYGDNTVSASVISAMGGYGYGVYSDAEYTDVNTSRISATGEGVTLDGGFNFIEQNIINSLNIGINDDGEGANSFGRNYITAPGTAAYFGASRVDYPDVVYDSTISGAAVGLHIARNANADDGYSNPGLPILGLTFTDLLPGATAINFEGGEIFISTFTDVIFNGNIAVNVNGAGLLDGSTVYMVNSVGLSSGPAFENDIVPDPAPGYIQWNTVNIPPMPPDPAGCDLVYNVKWAPEDLPPPAPSPGKQGVVSPDSGETGYYSGINDALYTFYDDYNGMRPGNTCIVIRDTQTYHESVWIEGYNAGSRLTIMADPTFVSSAPVIDPAHDSGDDLKDSDINGINSKWAAFAIFDSSVTIQHINIIPSGPVGYGILAAGIWGDVGNIIVSSVTIIDNGGMILNAGIGFVYSFGNNSVAGSTVIAGNGDYSMGVWSYSQPLVNLSEGDAGLISYGGGDTFITDSYIRGSDAVSIEGARAAAVTRCVLTASDYEAGIGLDANGNHALTVSLSSVAGGGAGMGIWLDNKDYNPQYVQETPVTITLSSVTITNAFDGLVISPHNANVGTQPQSDNAVYHFSNLTFKDPSPAGPMNTAISFMGDQVVTATFTAIAFDSPNIEVNVDAYPALQEGSDIHMAGASGVRSGPYYALDPLGYVKWTSQVAPWSGGSMPDGCGAGSLNVAQNVASDGVSTFTSIGDAVASLAGASLSNTTCIVIRDTGTYNESVTVDGFTFANNTSRLIITGDPALGSAMPSVVPYDGYYDAAFNILTASVTLSRMVISPRYAYLDYGVMVSSPNVALSSVTIDDKTDALNASYYEDWGIWAAGVYLNGEAGSGTVTQSHINVGGSGYGIMDMGTGGNIISNSRVTSRNSAAVAFGCSEEGPCSLYDSDYAQSSNNSVITSTLAGGYLGLYSYGTSNTVSDSVIVQPVAAPDEDMHVYAGLYFDYDTSGNSAVRAIINVRGNGAIILGDGNDISSSTIVAVDGDGIVLSGSGNHLVTNSNISVFAGETGVYLESGGNILSGSTITVEGWAGVYDYSAGSNTISGSVINAWDKNTEAGVYLDSGVKGDMISGSTVTTRGWAGAYDYSAGSNTVSGSVISGRDYGVYYDNNWDVSGGNTVTGSEISATGEYGTGVLDYSNGRNIVSGSFISAPGCGVDDESWGGNSISFSSITVTGVDGTGIYYSGDGGNTVSGSAISALYSGIDDESGDGATVSGSVISATGSGGTGVFDYSSGGDKISGSVISAMGEYGTGVYKGSYGGQFTLSTNTIAGSQYSLYIYPQGDTRILITSNTIISALSGDNNTYGIYIGGLTTGATIYNNGIYYRSSGDNSGYTAYGLYANAAAGLSFNHNRLNDPGLAAGGSIVMAYFEGVPDTDFRFNDVNSTGTGLTDAYLLQLVNSTVTVKNNIFLASWSVSGSSASLWMDSDSGIYSDYNDWFAPAGSNAAVLGGQSYPLAQSWAAGYDANSIFVDPLWYNRSAGAEDFHPESHTGRYSNGSWIIDGDHSPAIDKADPAEPYSDEPVPNGLRANLGSYGGTAEASKTGLLKPVLLTPLNGGMLTTKTPLFDWTDISSSYPNDAVYYEVRYSTTSDFSIVHTTSALIVSHFTLDAELIPHTVYYWSVHAYSYDSADAPLELVSPESAVWNFETPAAPGAPELHAFALSSATVNWHWTAAPAPAGAPSVYTLYTSTGWLIATLPGSATSFLETELTTAAAYSRYLKAENITGWALSSTVTVAIPISFDLAAGGVSSGTISDPATNDPLIDIPAGASGTDMRWLVSLDPVQKPLTDETPGLIIAAGASMPAGLGGTTTMIREYLVTINEERFTGLLGSSVTVYVSYTDADNDGNVDGTSPPVLIASLKLYTLNETTQLWEEVPGSVLDRVNHRVSAQVWHLSIYTALGTTAATDLSRALAYPNPWRPGSGGAYDATVITFTNLTAEATIRIFTLSGDLVRKLDKVSAEGNQKKWDGKNTDGARVATGVYYYVVSSPQCKKATGRLAVVR
ncbi:MAG: right-handed parallel beta-helix repeat-containing protein [Elusimicrobia bacterium]|nr:right-handed parallel beta-helix repeat-containing protein [Elusimicrobiota bacterium]